MARPLLFMDEKGNTFTTDGAAVKALFEAIPQPTVGMKTLALVPAAELEALRSRYERMEEALKPFYDVAKTLPDPRLINDEAPGVLEAHLPAFKATLGKLKIGDFRRVFWLMESAARALQQGDGAVDGGGR